VPPEWVFDAGVGELFVVRVAGNVLSPEVAGSLQYASSHLRTPLFVVLGHGGCGAVAAALASKYEGARHKSRIQALVDSIVPGLPTFGRRVPRAERLARAVESNVRWAVRRIEDSPEGRAHQSGGSVFHEHSYIHELHGRSDAIKLGHPINQLLRKECLRRRLRFPDIEIERLPVDGINREGL
jgi:carbonic anhydrase